MSDGLCLFVLHRCFGRVIPLVALLVLVAAANGADPNVAEPKSTAAKEAEEHVAKPEEFTSGRVVFRQSKNEERIREVLDKPAAAMTFVSTLQQDFAEHIAKEHKIAVAIDNRAMADDGKVQSLITGTTVEGQSLRSFLNSVLDPQDLSFVIENDRLLVTTNVAAQYRTPRRVYQVHDLISIPATSGAFESLSNLITSSVAPESWREAGGTQGEIVPFRADGIYALVITQTEAAHHQVETMLNDLRAARDAKVRDMQRKHPYRVGETMTHGEALRAAMAGATGEAQMKFPEVPQAKELVTASNRLGLDLYRKLVAERTAADNIVLSPIGTVAALGPIYSGAVGPTAQEFETKLGLPAAAQFQQQFAGLGRWMNDSTVLRGYKLRSRSHLFMQPDIRLTLGFVDTARRYYDVTPVPLDFAAKTGAARATIQQAAEQDSDGFLDVADLMKSIDASTRLAVVNTVDFRGRWEKPFPETATTTDPFHVPGGDKPTRLMNTLETLDYVATADVQMVRKPYESVRDAGTCALYVLLPADRPAAMANFEKLLTAERLDQLFAAMNQRKVQLQLPRFAFDNLLKQTEPLKQLGLVTAFGDDADFSGINGEPSLFLKTVEQKAKIEVNETQTRAAATTLVTMGAFGGIGSAPEVPQLVRCDRPFLFLIRDDTTGTILFFGRLAQPNAP